MKCFNCGCELSEKDFCTGCGADVGLYKKIMHISNRYYNDGLEKANVRDLSGAIVSLRQSLKFNKNHIEARNLLGLVYFEMGEVVAALSEWVISKNLRAKKNLADDYIDAIQSNPTRLDTINQTVKKYNLALRYCQQDSKDLAIIQLKKVLSLNPRLVQGHQLLALLYMDAEEWEKARKELVKCSKIDANNTTTLTYLKEVNRMLGIGEEAAGSSAKSLFCSRMRFSPSVSILFSFLLQLQRIFLNDIVIIAAKYKLGEIFYEKNSLDRADGGLPCASDRHSVPYQKPRPAGDRLVRQSGAGHRGADRRRLVRRDGRGHFAVLRVSARYRPGVFAVGAVRFAGQRRLRRPVCPACRRIPAKKEAARRIWQHGAGCRSKVCGAVSRPCPAGGPGCHPGSEAQHRHSGFYLAAASHSRDRRRAGLPDRAGPLPRA